MKIGDLARRLGTTPRTLRFYEELGLVAPGRSEGGTRRYDEEDLERFRAILTLAEAGMALSDIEVLARVRGESRTGDQASHRVYGMLERIRSDLKARREMLKRLEADVARAQALVERCFGCAEPPTPAGCGGCPVASRRHSAQVLRVIWEKDT
jgi:DNA-binding transcriptional MerR regulator